MEKSKIIIGILACFLLLSLGYIYYLNVDSTVIENENIFLKRIVNLGFGDTDISTEAEEYYDIASLKYESGDYKDAEINCKLSRDKLSEYIQTVKKDILIIEDYPEDIFKIYVDLLKEEINVRENEYEACEWLESACRQYDYYYLESTPYDDSSYEQASNSIEESNKKITARDDAVRRYNYLLEDYKLELEKLI